MLIKTTNGNAEIIIEKNGTRTIEFENKLKLEYPLNLDIRVTTSCSLGKNPKTNKAFCNFCHESAVTNGVECDYELLKDKLIELPKGIELAIGGNNITPALIDFLKWCKNKDFICNLTSNHLHINRDGEKLKYLLKNNIIKGLGISYRKTSQLNLDKFFIEHPNVILHVIAGIDEVDDILKTPFKKILVLGYKKFGFGETYYSNEIKDNLQKWYWWVNKLFIKDIISFDNLAIEQLNIKRFFDEKTWETFYQGEHSFYINAVDKYFAPSSRSDKKTYWNNITIKKYFEEIENKNT